MNKSKNEICALAAKLIVEEGFNYFSAKNQAADQLSLGGRNYKKTKLPSNQDIDGAVKEYLDIFYKEECAVRLASLKKIGFSIMSELEEFNPLLIGSISSGFATKFSTIKICCFCESSKELIIALMERNITCRSIELKHPTRNYLVEAINLIWSGEEVYLYAL